MSLVTTIMVVLAAVVFLYNLYVMASGPRYPTPTYPNRTTYEEKVGTWPETEGTWPEVEEE